jgi:copper chaperone CopZ
MTISEIVIENIACDNCFYRIKIRLKNLTGVFSVVVNKELATLKIEHNTSIKRAEIVSLLKHMGYAESKKNTLESVPKTFYRSIN